MKLSKRIKKILLASAVMLFTVVIFVVFAPRSILRCYLVKWSTLDKPAPNIYIDPDMSVLQREEFLASLTAAQERLSKVYGNVLAKPVIIAGHTMDVMASFGGNSYNRSGRTYLTIVKSFIILGPEGTFSVDVLAHELAHVEFAIRIGYWQKKRIPNWFDEGLALQFDDRYTETEWRRETDNGRTAPAIDKIATIGYNDWLAYATAKHEVKRFLDIVGQEGLHELILAIRKSDTFQETYHRIEQARTTDKQE